MEWEFTHGKMEDNTEASIRMIRSTDMEYTLGQMEEHTLATGVEESNMDLAHIQYRASK